MGVFLCHASKQIPKRHFLIDNSPSVASRYAEGSNEHKLRGFTHRKYAADGMEAIAKLQFLFLAEHVATFGEFHFTNGYRVVLSINDEINLGFDHRIVLYATSVFLRLDALDAKPLLDLLNMLHDKQFECQSCPSVERGGPLDRLPEIGRSPWIVLQKMQIEKREEIH